MDISVEAQSYSN